MTENPDTIRAEIEATRARLGTNVDAVADKVTPANIVHRQTDKVKDALFGVKEKVMGAADHATSNVHSATGTAFGAGLLVSSLIPASAKEREAADALKAAAEPVTTQLTEAAKDMAQGLKEPAQEAMENVKATAADAAAAVKDEGQTAVSDVKDKAADAKDRVQNT
jgi:gas vesicle protein